MGDSPERIVQAQGIQVTDPTPEDLERVDQITEGLPVGHVHELRPRIALALVAERERAAKRAEDVALRGLHDPATLGAAVAAIRGAGAGTGEKRPSAPATEPAPKEKPLTAPPYCGWCEAFRERKRGCCGREGWHHHTSVLTGPGTIRVIPNDDCPRGDPPVSPPSEPETLDAETERLIDSFCDTWTAPEGLEEDLRALVRDVRRPVEQRVKELELSCVSHFQRDHLEGDGPEIDRWKRKLAESERLLSEARQAGREYIERTDPLVSCAAWAHGGETEKPCGDCLSCYMDLLSEARNERAAEQDAIYADLGLLLEAVGLPNVARPESPHEVMLECIRRASEARKERDEARTEADRQKMLRILEYNARMEEINRRGAAEREAEGLAETLRKIDVSNGGPGPRQFRLDTLAIVCAALSSWDARKVAPRACVTYGMREGSGEAAPTATEPVAEHCPSCASWWVTIRGERIISGEPAVCVHAWHHGPQPEPRPSAPATEPPAEDPHE